MALVGDQADAGERLLPYTVSGGLMEKTEPVVRGKDRAGSSA